MCVVWQILWNISPFGISHYAWQTCCCQPQQIVLISLARADASLTSCNKILRVSSRCGILKKVMKSVTADGSRMSTLSLLFELYSVCAVPLLLCTEIFWSISLYLTVFCALHRRLDATLRHRHWILTYLLISQVHSNGHVSLCSDRVVVSCCLYTALFILHSISYILYCTFINKPLYKIFYHYYPF